MRKRLKTKKIVKKILTKKSLETKKHFNKKKLTNKNFDKKKITKKKINLQEQDSAEVVSMPDVKDPNQALAEADPTVETLVGAKIRQAMLIKRTINNFLH